MGAAVHAKIVKGRKLWYVYGSQGNTRWQKEYPECRSRFELYEILRAELGLPSSTSRTDVVMTLFHKTWDGGRWRDDFSLQLRRLREKAGLTQGELAERAGLSVQAISALEKGFRSPSWDTVQRLAVALEIEETDFKLTLPKEDVARSIAELE